MTAMDYDTEDAAPGPDTLPAGLYDAFLSAAAHGDQAVCDRLIAAEAHAQSDPGLS